MNAERIVPELRTALARGDHPAVADVVERHWLYVLRTDPPLLGQAIALLPPELTRPPHHLIREILHPRTLPEAADGSDPVVHALASLPSDDPELEVASGLALLQTLRRQGRFQQAHALAIRLVGSASQLPATEANSHVSSLFLAAGDLSLLRADFAEAERWFEAAYRRPSPFPNHAADAAGRMALACALRGETARTEGWLQRAQTADAAAEPWPLRAAERLPQHCARAMLALDRLDWATYHRADDLIETERIDQDEIWTYVLHHRSLAAAVRGNQRAVLEEVVDYRNRNPQYWDEPTLGTLLVDTIETALLLTVGRRQAALQRLDATHPSRMHPASRAHLLLAGGRVEEAAALSDPERWPPGTTRRQQVLMLVAHAGAQYRMGRRGAAVAAMRQALNLTGNRREAWLYNFSTMDRAALADLVPDVTDLEHVLEALEELAPVPLQAAVSLTPRETLVLQHLARGLSVQQISELLFVSASTVKNQRKSLYRKLGASSRATAVHAATQMGLLRRSRGSRRGSGAEAG
ncbi:LuxR C-terminal-related transcriptional regulator [Auraticoccus monumenti]|uniref:Regulatory protein, luxR family n=1 Tax=Auraticoccus monumenti TaxID=675864 RepID=A0A1G6U2N6_9ACTN|nr:LuxR C-terminal-related transcriptional regulator [Auraticoccus monumenti]SDD35609.1 regulatory protein, luxR family [Auraticoccus monumenti]